MLSLFYEILQCPTPPACRYEALAPVGGIWISKSYIIMYQIRKKLIAGLLREILKNVKEPVKIYEVMLDNFTRPINFTGKESSKKVLEKSIAVLPFEDMSAAHDQEYLGDGLAEELINVFAQIKELKVIGRTSSFSFKGTKTDLKTIGQILSAENILEGSVQKAGPF